VARGSAERTPEESVEESVPLFRSSGNLWRDLGRPEHEARSLQLRADLMIALRSRFERLGWNQTQAARALGVTQPRISDLFRGKLDRFSVDALVDLLFKSGVEVSFRLRPTRTA
jgi:predicted XRE-type DNA-binding protein